MSWEHYVEEFHREHAAITEDVLGHCTDRAGGDPYDWLLEAVPREGAVLDLACGSAPLRHGLGERRYLGVDLSPAELAAAGRAMRAMPAGTGSLVRATASALPIAAGTVDIVVCSMSLMILTPLTAVLAETARVLAPGGLLVATMPGRRLRRPRDLAVTGGLLAALRSGLGYPNDRALRHAAELFARAGLRLDGDQQRRFGYRLRTPRDADLFASSLYLPDLPPSRRRRAHRYLRTLTYPHTQVPVPIRRITAHRTP